MLTDQISFSLIAIITQLKILEKGIIIRFLAFFIFVMFLTFWLQYLLVFFCCLSLYSLTVFEFQMGNFIQSMELNCSQCSGNIFYHLILTSLIHICLIYLFLPLNQGTQLPDPGIELTIKYVLTLRDI